MRDNVSRVLNNIAPYVVPIIVGIVSLVVGVVCVVLAINLLKKQVKLYNSISLVSLKHTKVHYWIFMLILAFFIFYIVMQMIDPNGSEVIKMLSAMNIKRWLTNTCLAFLLGLLVCVGFLLGTLASAKCAVVDRGVYAGIKYLDWYHVHDYIIDEDRGLVILSCNKFTFGTLVGTTPPLKVAKNDIPKLKFILNKNKNKFSSFDANESTEEVVSSPLI